MAQTMPLRPYIHWPPDG